MDPLSTFLTIIVGLLLRFGIPIALTAVVIYLLKRLDEHWQADARRELIVAPMAHNTGCWDVKNCSPEQRKKCSAYSHPETPCWQQYRDKRGYLQEQCLGCDVFRQAPVPVSA